MDLNYYFDPVSLDKPDFELLPSRSLFSRNIYIHTPNTPINDINNYDIAILGVREDRNSPNKGCSEGPDKIRTWLYQLSKPKKKFKIIDLGNIKKGENVEDTYFALRDVVSELLNQSVFPIVIGGSQDLTYGIFNVYKEKNTFLNLVSIDSRIDWKDDPELINSQYYLNKIISGKEIHVQYNNIGHQDYLTDDKLLTELRQKHFNSFRVGVVRSDITEMEPVLRDAHIVSLDISSVRQSDSPGHFSPSPNGFYGEEICQLAKYAGQSDNLQVFGIFETNPVLDVNNQSSRLAAQIIWYLFEGLSQKIVENPAKQKNRFTKYIVNLSGAGKDIVFYKSNHTERWWLKMPVSNNSAKTEFIACTYNDYMKASNQEIPDRWWKTFQKQE